MERIKTCYTCGETKPLSLFYPREGASDGYRNQCKKCNSAAVMARRRARKHNPATVFLSMPVPK